MPPLPFDALSNAAAMMDRLRRRWVRLHIEKVPYSIRAVRDFWRASGQHSWVFWPILIALALLVGYTVLRYYQTKPKKTARAVIDNPDRLFDDLLGELEGPPTGRRKTISRPSKILAGQCFFQLVF